MKNQNALRAGNLDGQSNYEYGETENCSRKLSEEQGEHSEESTSVFERLVKSIGGVCLGNPFIRALHFFPVLVGLIVNNRNLADYIKKSKGKRKIRPETFQLRSINISERIHGLVLYVESKALSSTASNESSSSKNDEHRQDPKYRTLRYLTYREYPQYRIMRLLAVCIFRR